MTRDHSGRGPSRPIGGCTTDSSTGPARPATSPQSLGTEGEGRAARYLARRGYRIVDRNVRAGGVELDLVVRRGRWLVFVEVKTRRTRRFGEPELAVDRAKQARLVRGAAAWLQSRGPHRGPIRFDVIAWQVDPAGPQGREEWQLRHVEGAFEAGD